MSMHEIEDLVFESVVLLDRHHPAGDDRLRDWFVALYDFQFTFDCSITQGRVRDILLRRGHTYRFPISEHPDYARRRAFFDGLNDFTDLHQDDEPPERELETGYVDPPWLYCEAGSKLWQRMAGPDAVPPRRVRLIEVALHIAAAAEQAGDVELIAHWYGLGHEILVGGAPFDVDDLLDSPGVAELREIVRRTGALEIELPDGYRPTDEQIEIMDSDLDRWWYSIP
ncbi:hypothetical protein [Actinoplanes sp. HUAS TT8]|uniref:hypothetical protein n=1 Tax=Actinoplanes sp. HUAS TT8 TaxID=3447453 RepID=UPI003F5222CF